jgi:hypothetical protein
MRLKDIGNSSKEQSTREVEVIDGDRAERPPAAAARAIIATRQIIRCHGRAAAMMPTLMLPLLAYTCICMSSERDSVIIPAFPCTTDRTKGRVGTSRSNDGNH